MFTWQETDKEIRFDGTGATDNATYTIWANLTCTAGNGTELISNNQFDAIVVVPNAVCVNAAGNIVERPEFVPTPIGIYNFKSGIPLDISLEGFNIIDYSQVTTIVEFFGNDKYFSFDEGDLKISYTGEQVVDQIDYGVTIDLKCEGLGLENNYEFQMNIYPSDDGTADSIDVATADDSADNAADDSGDGTADNPTASTITETESVVTTTEEEEIVTKKNQGE